MNDWPKVNQEQGEAELLEWMKMDSLVSISLTPWELLKVMGAISLQIMASGDSLQHKRGQYELLVRLGENIPKSCKETRRYAQAICNQLREVLA